MGTAASEVKGSDDRTRVSGERPIGATRFRLHSRSEVMPSPSIRSPLALYRIPHISGGEHPLDCAGEGPASPAGQGMSDVDFMSGFRNDNPDAMNMQSVSGTACTGQNREGTPFGGEGTDRV